MGSAQRQQRCRIGLGELPHGRNTTSGWNGSFFSDRVCIDFVYFSFTLGMTFQTSDIAITGAHIRKVVLGHTAAAFLFNMGVLAFVVNALGAL